jgi:D-3-phosphoglycerate dehydrogenase
VHALDEGRLRQYLTDFGDDVILGRDDVVVTPHIGGSTLEAEANGAVQGAQTIMSFLETGNVNHSVNLPTLQVPFTTQYRLTLMHQNKPNMVGQIATMLAQRGINIEGMSNAARDDVAYSIIDVNQFTGAQDAELLGKLKQIDAVYRVRLLRRPEPQVI